MCVARCRIPQTKCRNDSRHKRGAKRSIARHSTHRHFKRRRNAKVYGNMKTLHPSSQFKKDVKRIKIVIALPLTPPFNFFLNIFSAENLQIRKNRSTFASLSEKERAFSSAGSEHLPYKQRVGGSNPSTPTLPRPLPAVFFIIQHFTILKTNTHLFFHRKIPTILYICILNKTITKKETILTNAHHSSFPMWHIRIGYSQKNDRI